MVQSAGGKNSALTKPFIIALLILWLQIPMYYITGLIRERDLSKQQATEQVAQMAGGQQLLTTPVLTIGYTTAPNEAGSRVRGQAVVLPHILKVNGKLTTSIRNRGIFEIPVYAGAVAMEGEFHLSDLGASIIGEGSVLDNQGALALGVLDLRGIKNAPLVAWNDEKVEFSPGVPVQGFMDRGIQASVTIDSAQKLYRFSTELELGGSTRFLVRPFAKSAHLTLTSNWADPSFVGALMPSERTLDEKGFSADWHLSDLSLGTQVAWAHAPAQFSGVLEKATAGVELLSPIDSHRMSERATKYELLFFFLIFLAFFVYEVLAEIRIHPIQYMLVGGALTLFYLLILTLSEHIGFTAAYLIATALSTGLVSGYARAILRRAGKTWIIPPLMVGMYGFLYTLLVEEDYALLSGSLGLALILGILMYITRNVDWFTFGSPTKSDGPITPQNASEQPVS